MKQDFLDVNYDQEDAMLDDDTVQNKAQFKESQRHKLKKYEIKVDVEDCGCVHETIYSDAIEKKSKRLSFTLHHLLPLF